MGRTLPVLIIPKLGIHEKERLSHLSEQLVCIPHILVEKLGKSFTAVPKFVLRQGSKSQNSYQPRFLFPHAEFSSFISSLDARCQCRQILCFAATLASRSQIGLGGWSFGF
ncbi:hypothetical protein AVEN_251445-1 [Araneus ventricosus]|uniref:Uncharacterized protein n=1 Tax=Araneus ventricosus TaxID=182803 RepID=A0A4Y2U610_ARAVE|nr:hypothetical protein AVEN_251445-1 [Araneus ventricosus]